MKVFETYLGLDVVEEWRFKTEMEREVNKEIREMGASRASSHVEIGFKWCQTP